MIFINLQANLIMCLGRTETALFRMNAIKTYLEAVIELKNVYGLFIQHLRAKAKSCANLSKHIDIKSFLKYHLRMDPNTLLTINEAASVLGVTTQTMRRWDRSGILLADERTAGNQRRYKMSSLRPRKENNPPNNPAIEKIAIGYARVSTQNQLNNLQNQKDTLAKYCQANEWSFQIIADIGSGVDSQKKGLHKLLQAIIQNNVSKLVITQKDRLLSVGSELILTVCELMGVEVLIINKSGCSDFQDDAICDTMEIIGILLKGLGRCERSRSKKTVTKLEKIIKYLEETKYEGDRLSQNG